MFVSAAKVILDFYGNQNIARKRSELEKLIKDVERHFRVSIVEVSDFDDLERCVLGLALVAGSEQGAKTALKRALDHIDQHSFARVVMEDSQTTPFDGDSE